MRTNFLIWLGLVCFHNAISASSVESGLDFFWAPDNGEHIIKQNLLLTENGGYNSTVYASNQFQRDESVTFGNNRDYTINEYINFEAEDQLKYVIIIDIKNGDYNVTIDSFPFTRIPPAALKSLVG